MTAPTGLIDAERITRRDASSGKTLLAPTDFSLAAGSRIAITGPSGSGKSVLLRALALLDPLDGGHILWRGKRIRRNAIPRYRRSVAYVRQRPAQMDGTVESQLRYPYSLAIYRDVAFDRARAEALAAQAGRGPDFLDKRASDLSGGEAQIAALLRVLQLDPDVLLLDEPTSALDPESARAIEALVGAWFDAAPDARAYMWISHDPAQAARIGTMRLVMQAGVMHVAKPTEATQ
ncbi:MULTISPECIES: ATP-binding cassette domain-containing protein [Burkholderia]|uniref:ABC transporter ATP-binding protein n=1 Tax=Burkholderia TaxID=32008 RepID=UPI001453ADBB|nr:MULTISPECIES: ATP-binding cassette domain-containing protein [Burkholderia]MBN3798943.1 ATP-binding cassette domain-containing protein [Burkholderia sp. Ac-20392]VWB82777.1 ABC transporter ATP-binding protein [Burkholderia lata]